MRISVITPNYNGALFLEETVKSVLSQRTHGVELEYIVVDGGSTDGSITILDKYRDGIDTLIVENDNGPADAINKGLSVATGDVIAWLNADDIYFPGAVRRAIDVFHDAPDAPFCFGRCPIVNESGQEIRGFITGFKESFFPISSRFTFQVINYISQPAMFFRSSALKAIGTLRDDMVAAWDYEYLLRLWQLGDGYIIPGGPVSAFRWHGISISGQNFHVQFKEELEAAAIDAGRYSPQVMLHHFVRWGIVSAYSGMQYMRKIGNRGDRADA